MTTEFRVNLAEIHLLRTGLEALTSKMYTEAVEGGPGKEPTARTLANQIVDDLVGRLILIEDKLTYEMAAERRRYQGDIPF